MGKKRHSQDKMWLTYKELVEEHGGKKYNVYGSNISHLNSIKLPFDHCNLSLTKFNNPVCLKDGTIFDILNILPYIKKYKKNPITGEPISAKDLIKLNFFKNERDDYYCPITCKVFNENSEIIAIKETGNVFSNEAYINLNVKDNNYYDLIDNTPFNKDNVIIIQSKNNKFKDINNYYYIKNKDDMEFIKKGDFSIEALKDDISLVKNNNDLYDKLTSANNVNDKKEESVNLGSQFRSILDNYEKDSEDKLNSETIKREDILDKINSSSNNNNNYNNLNNINNSNGEVIKSKIIDSIVNLEKEEYSNIRNKLVTRISKNIFSLPVIVNDLENMIIRKKINVRKEEKSTVYSFVNDEIKLKLVKDLKANISKSEINSIKNQVMLSSFTYLALDLDKNDSFSKVENQGKASQSTTSTTFSASYNSNFKAKLSIKDRRKIFYNKIKQSNLDTNNKDYNDIKNNVYVTINTNYGSMRIMLFYKEAPKACENFIELAQYSYYNNTKFHRLIKSFMIQGGDPSYSGFGGESIFGDKFEDEFSGKLKHNKRGILSMANSGPNTNGSQFFILFKEANHLNNKHTIFGEVVEGLEVLNSLEKIDCGSDDKPLVDVIIKSIDIDKNPYREFVSNIVFDELLIEAIGKVVRIIHKNNSNNIDKESSIDRSNKNHKSLKICKEKESDEIGKYLNKKLLFDKQIKKSLTNTLDSNEDLELKERYN